MSSALLQKPDPFLDEKKALTCIHCGLCLGSCPTYLETGNENDSPRGRIYLMRSIQEGTVPLGDHSVRHVDLCLGCRACEAACPSGVQYGALLEATRDFVEKKYERSAFQRFIRRFIIEQIFPFPWRTKLSLIPARMVRALKLEGFMPEFARNMLALIPEKISSRSLPKLSPAASEKKGKVGFIRGCVMSVMFGDTNASSVWLLNQAGYDVLTPRSQGCCGALYAHGGNLEKARECARHNIAAFEKLDLDAIIINAAGCGSTLKEYHHLLHDDPVWAERAEKFVNKMKDITEWLAKDPSKAPTNCKHGSHVTYHDACHLAHAQRITKPPRELVKRVAGEGFIELPESDVCCGSAGSYNITEPEMADRLQKRKVENILKTGAKTVVTSNPGCLLQMQAGLKKAGVHDVEVLHIADYMARQQKQHAAK
jgi:glycolate oxidase iron-sulfur subunit